MSLNEDVYTELRRRLIAGSFNPGDKLKEEQVAREFGVSRTPVRSAIQRLIEQGLLEAAPKRGAIVSEWKESDAEEIFELRVFAEGQAAAWACSRITDEQLANMDAINSKIASALRDKPKGYLSEVQSSNLAFHTALYDACGSARLRHFGTNLLEYPLISGGFYIYSDEDAHQSVRQHTEIVNALRSRNASWARSAVTSHLSAAIDRFRKSRRTRTSQTDE
ncbi:GntR family transcriptional regulator [Celeribacter halophilus]|uniref:GntR family transcriptional regulator n=1 Tax=Celeribacter halophilus TaxID=576117 RepID=UPI001C08CC20|nr:GntR family transcriptional regulator [Celeribacter halophilus]MBU2890830.1 GntR family transcriptional regulator [Celeribacter halophilus]MDO6510005.1 GntR family transcriptional regulator [Celeribacter halophilus]